MDCIGNPTDWAVAATSALLEARHADGGFAYRVGDGSSTEPTALALLALAGAAVGSDVIDTAADWLIARQREDGFFTASAVHLEPSWATPLAALALNLHGRTAAAASAVDALLGEPVFTFSPALARGIYGYDTSIPGWPWTHGDFSFVEPTALAMLFLKRMGQGDAGRVRDGAALLRARTINGGGWNYGESHVLGNDLYATVAPTALSLLALVDEQDEATASGLTWLLGQSGAITSLLSLGWAGIALNVLGVLSDAWRQDIRTVWCMSAPERRGAMETALCLLALREGPNHPLAVS